MYILLMLDLVFLFNKQSPGFISKPDLWGFWFHVSFTFVCIQRSWNKKYTRKSLIFMSSLYYYYYYYLDQGFLYSILRMSATFTPMACSHRWRSQQPWWRLCLREQAVPAAFPVLKKKNKEYHSLSVLNYFDPSDGGTKDISYTGSN